MADDEDDDRSYEDESDGERDCFLCGGEGYDDCDDPIECTSPQTRDGLCPCKSCGGSGLAKDMTIW